MGPEAQVPHEGANRMNRRLRRPRTSLLRRGVAVVELAVCMPLLSLITLATIESCQMIFLQQSLTVAVYEGCRVALAPKAEAANAQYQVELILSDRGVKGAKVTVTPSSIQAAAAGTWIRVEATAPFSKNSLVGGWLFNSKNLIAAAEMMKER